MEFKLDNYDINNVNLPPELPPPNDWMVEMNLTQAETRKTILSLHIYVTIKRDGNIAAMG